MISTRSKIIRDPVHGLIEVEPLLLEILDSSEFQRMREIRQLAMAHLVYPGCNHTRFEHCLGTYHVAKRLLEMIASDVQYTGPKLSESESLAVRVAALCHDIGHGPLSHTWEQFVHRGGEKYKEYSHEKMACRIIDRIFANNTCLREQAAASGLKLDLVKSLILGETTDLIPWEKRYIYEILSNRYNGVDVDKWDYLLRDCLHAGFGQGCAALELDRFLHFYRPALHIGNDQDEADEWHMSFKCTELENVLRAFSLRQHLHRKVYKHKTCLAITEMLFDALEAVEPLLQNRVTSLAALKGSDPAQLDNFLRLQDSLIWNIYNGCVPALANLDGANKMMLDKAQHLIHRVHIRDLYRYVDNANFYNSPCLTLNEPTSDQPTTANGEHIHRVLPEESALFNAISGVGFLRAILMDNIPVINRLPDGKTLGPQAQILEEILSCLPECTPLKDGEALRVVQCTVCSNSTNVSPQFFFYTKDGKTFTYQQPLGVVNAILLYLTDNGGRQTEGGLQVTNNDMDVLKTAFQLWRDTVLQR